jgi:hypothetical protein
MADLISRAALLNECAECQKTDPHFEGRGWASHFINDAGEPSTEWYCVEDMIENAPAVDAAPVVHGRWIDENPDDFLDPRMRCSICTGIESPLIKWRYCPNCGAKMDGET